MTKHSFMDTILNRPSQRYTEPVPTKPSRHAAYAPTDLPNAPNKPDSILAGNMFSANGAGSLSRNGGGGGVYSQAPSVMSGRSNTSRFSMFGRKKNRAPSISGASIYHDGASSIAPSEITTSPRKGRWWESGSRNKYSSRPPSVAGSVFSEPEASGPPGFPYISDSLKASAPPRGARSDYGAPTSSRIRYSSHPSQPPMPSLSSKASMSALKRQSGVAPLGHQQPNLMRQSSATSLTRSTASQLASTTDLNRPVSPAASMGRSQSTRRAPARGSNDWNSFVKSMSGTDTAKVWESMPTLAPKQPRNAEKRSSMVASRVKKELEQDAQFQQVQRDPGVVQQDLLARAASQVIGDMPPTPVSPLSGPQVAAVHLQPGQIVTPISPVYSPVASTSSVNVAQYSASMALHAAADTELPPQAMMPPTLVAAAPAALSPAQSPPPQPQPVAYVPVPDAQLPHAHANFATAPQQYAQPAPAVVAQAQALPPQSPTHTYAPVAVAAPRAAVQPAPAQYAAQPPHELASSSSIPPPIAAAAPPTTAQFLADRIQEQEDADEVEAVTEPAPSQQATPEETEESQESDESEESEASSDEGLVGGGQPALDVVAEEDEDGSSIGHNHREMLSHNSVKGKGPRANYEEFEARLHRRQASMQSQTDANEDAAAAAISGVSIHVTEPSAAGHTNADAAAARAEPLPAAPQLVVDAQRPQLVCRASEFSEYQSVTSGRSSPVAKEAADEANGEASPVASIVRPRVSTKPSTESISADTASVSPSQRRTNRASKASRPDTAQRRLSEISLGTSFAVSGILGRSGSSMRQNGDDDSDVDADLSDDDAELRAKSLAEQQRLRKMNLGEDFFGPSISNMLDRFDRFDHSDTTVNKLVPDSEQPVAAPALVEKSAPITTPAAPVARSSDVVDTETESAVMEVRQKRAEAAAAIAADGNKRNSASTDLAPSLAAVWLLNQANGTEGADQQAAEDAGDVTLTASKQLDARDSAEPKVSVLNRPRPKAKRPTEMGGLLISQGRLEPESPRRPAEDTRSTLPASLSQNSLASAASAPSAGHSSQATPIKAAPVALGKDKTSLIQSTPKAKPSRSLADTLFGIPFRSPGKEKKEKKEKKAKKDKHKRDASVDSIGSSSVKSERSSLVESVKDRTSADSTRVPAADVPASPSAKALGKQKADVAPAPQGGALVASETVGQFATPPQSMANLQGVAGADVSPERFHTAYDLKALADTAVPVYPTELQNAASAHVVAQTPAQVAPQASAADARPAHQRNLSEQMKGMNGFGSFSLPQLDAPQPRAPTAEQQQAAQPLANANVDGAAPKTNGAVAEAQLAVPAQDSPAAETMSATTSAPASSEASVASTSLTSPDVVDVAPTQKPVATEVGERVVPAPALPVQQVQPHPEALSVAEKRLPMPPPPDMDDVMAVPHDDRTPTGKPQQVPGVGINLIPPTPPALETRTSFTSSRVPGTPTIEESEDEVAPQRPPLMSRSSSQRTAVRADSKPNGSSDNLVRSKSMAPTKKGVWTEYKGKGLSLPPGLVATTIDSSVLRRMSMNDKKSAQAAAPAPAQAPLASAAPSNAVHALPVAPIVGQVVPVAHAAIVESPQRPVRATPSPSPKSKRRSASPGAIPHSSSMSKIMAEAPPVPPVPVGYQGMTGAPSVSSSSSRLYAPSVASSEPGWDSRSVSPAPSAVPSQSGRSAASHVSSSIHSSVRGSPRPEATYVNHHELSPYAKKMRALSPSPVMPTLAQTGNRHSLMSAINEWESQVPEGEAAGVSPYPSRPTSPHPYPPLPASTVSRSSSVISAVSSPAVVRNAPLGAATNQYLHPPVARSRMSVDGVGMPSVAESVAESLSPPSIVGRGSGASSASSSPSASQSVISLTSTIPTSMPTVPTSYRPNKDPKRFSTNVDDLLNNRTTMQTVAVTSGAFAGKSKVARRKRSSVDLNGERRSSSDVPEHLQDELSLTTLSITAHTPPPRKIGSHQVLVQVIAVAIDETDKLLLREKVRGDNAFGFVPGRSFCGRLVECGYEVKKMRKGDVVFGLQDSRKSGALAEFTVVDHNRICHAPSDCLTTEQIAALPSAGVMAHQLVHNHCSQLPRGARVLILNAHDGVGLLTMQESVGLGLVIVAQCPPSVSDGVAVCQANGAHEVVIGEPLWAINSLHESSFDLIVDTVGGRKIYDASRRILACDGQFCTCFGDEHGTANPNLKSHFRSLRRAFFKKDKKNIGYEWVGVDTGEDCKQALEAVKRAAESGDICPRLRSVLPFADAPRAFDPTTRNVNDEPGAIVVRVS